MDLAVDALVERGRGGTAGPPGPRQPPAGGGAGAVRHPPRRSRPTGGHGGSGRRRDPGRGAVHHGRSPEPARGHPLPAARRARALTGLARYYLDHQHQAPTGRVGRPHVLVLVDLEVLEARTGGSAVLASGGHHRGPGPPPGPRRQHHPGDHLRPLRTVGCGAGHPQRPSRHRQPSSPAHRHLPLPGLHCAIVGLRCAPSTTMGPSRPHRAPQPRPALLAPPRPRPPPRLPHPAHRPRRALASPPMHLAAA